MLDKLNADVRFHSEALNLRARRQEVLAANIANADTPNYKARDFDFAARLSEAVEARSPQALSLATTSARHLQASSTLAQELDLLYRIPHQSSLDGNTVEMDAERVNFADNALRYETNLKVLGSKFKGLLSAVQP